MPGHIQDLVRWGCDENRMSFPPRDSEVGFDDPAGTGFLENSSRWRQLATADSDSRAGGPRTLLSDRCFPNGRRRARYPRCGSSSSTALAEDHARIDHRHTAKQEYEWEETARSGPRRIP